MSSPRDYLGAIFAKPEDREDSGVKGMRWGVRRTREELASSSSKSDIDKPEGPETSQARYSRLQSQAKSGGGAKMSDEDLKFFNARTEALAKVAKMNETNPGWLRSTTKTVIQKTAQRQMQGLSDTLADKFIGDRLKNAIKPPEDTDAAAGKKSESKKKKS